MYYCFPFTMIRMMEEKEMAKDEMADLIGVSRSTFFRYSNGDSVPDLHIIIRICRVLGCTPNALLPEACD